MRGPKFNQLRNVDTSSSIPTTMCITTFLKRRLYTYLFRTPGQQNMIDYPLKEQQQSYEGNPIACFFMIPNQGSHVFSYNYTPSVLKQLNSSSSPKYTKNITN